MKKVILAFSGGLDTSYCAKYLSHVKKMEVHTVTVNTGGFTDAELNEITQKAKALGVTSHKNIEATERYYQQCVKYLIFGNVLKNNTYPLSVSAERVTQAIAVADYAKKLNADYIAHGSTGAGNDQVRFDVIFNVLTPEIQVLSPIRDMKLSREEEINFLNKSGVDINPEKVAYSINKGLWGTSVGGRETLTSDKYLPEEAFPNTLSKKQTERITLYFIKGELTGINGNFYGSSVEAIRELELMASPFAIGRDIHVGDTIIGIKGRVGFEAAAAMITIKAHHLLEKHILTKWQLHWKEQLGSWYGQMLHEGLFLDPAMRNIETFLEETQHNVTGEVRIVLAPYRFTLEGIVSEFDMMHADFGSYGEMNNAWTGEDVRGYSKIIANQAMIWHKVNEKNAFAAKKKQIEIELAD
jgi:argininosuccinate synthase